jgi:urocanate hydratase
LDRLVCLSTLFRSNPAVKSLAVLGNDPDVGVQVERRNQSPTVVTDLAEALSMSGTYWPATSETRTQFYAFFLYLLWRR